MSSETEALALHLVHALYNTASGPHQWRMLAGLDGETADAIEFAVARGWMIVEGRHSVCLTEPGCRLGQWISTITGGSPALQGWQADRRKAFDALLAADGEREAAGCAAQADGQELAATYHAGSVRR